MSVVASAVVLGLIVGTGLTVAAQVRVIREIREDLRNR